MTRTKQRTTRYPDEPHPTPPNPHRSPSCRAAPWSAPTRGILFASLLVATPVAAQTTGRPGGAQASGSWQMPGSTTTTAPAPPPAPSPEPTPPSYSGYGYGSYAPVHPGYPSYGGYANPPAAPPDRAIEQEDDEEEAPPFLDVALSTQVPLSIGGLVSLELPARLMLQLEAGWMPPGYGAAINGLVQSFAGYDDGVGALIDQAFDSAAVVRAAGGWRPFPSAGFEIFGGYTYVGLSGSVSPTRVAEVIGGEFADQVAQQLVTDEVDVSSQLHNFHVGLGWRWVAFEHLVIRANVAYMQTVASSTTVETPDNPAAGEIATPIANRILGDVYETYVKLPVFGLSVGYRF